MLPEDIKIYVLRVKSSCYSCKHATLWLVSESLVTLIMCTLCTGASWQSCEHAAEMQHSCHAHTS